MRQGRWLENHITTWLDHENSLEKEESDVGKDNQRSWNTMPEIKKNPQSLGWRTKSDDLSAEILQSSGGNRGLAHFKLLAWVFQDFNIKVDLGQLAKTKAEI